MKSVLSKESAQMLSKVPEVTTLFWVIKVMGTTVGDTAADFLSFNLHLGLNITSVFMSGLLLISLFIQIRYRRYVPWIYWITVVLISIVGTLITDDLVDNFGVSLKATTIIFSILLIVTFIAWYMSEKTLSIHSIYTTKRELFMGGHSFHVCPGDCRRRSYVRRSAPGLCFLSFSVCRFNRGHSCRFLSFQT